MKHWTMPVAIALLFSGVSPAQELAARPAPRTGDGILGPQLIAWSEMQKPQPVPQRPQPVPVPDSNADKQEGPTEDTPQQQPAQDAKAPAQEKQGLRPRHLTVRSSSWETSMFSRPQTSKRMSWTTRTEPRNMRASR